MNNKSIIILLAGLFTCLLSQAQPYVSNLGRFQVDQIKGCAPLTINVTMLGSRVCKGATPCDIDYENTNQFLLNDTVYTYTTPGTYLMRLSHAGDLGLDDIMITVLQNIQPSFDVYSCGGNSAQVNITDTNYDQYVINYNDSSPDSIVVVPSGSLAKDNHTFASSGPKTISVHGRNLGAADNCDPMIKNIDALLTLPAPTITQLQVLDNASIKLDFNNQPNILYKLEIAANSAAGFQLYQNVYNSNTATATNLQPDNAFYCFRLGAFDPCNNITVYSNTICSADLDAIAQNQNNRLTWATSPIVGSSYSITKINSTSLSAVPPQATLDDADIVCGTNYCYQLTTLYANGSRSISLEKCVTAISTEIPTTTENISAQVTSGNSVDLTWTQDPAFSVSTYNILKTGTSVGTSTTPTFSDTNFQPDAQPCYVINYTDACGNKSLNSTNACPIFLVGSLTPDNKVNLSWSAYAGWKNGVDHYTIERYDGAGLLQQSFDTGTATFITDSDQDPNNQIYIYKVTAFAVDGSILESTSNTITVIKEPNLFHPTAFTPNGDGLNDSFLVVGQYITTVEFKIFNRWGELLFLTTDLGQSWDGSYKGNIMPEGTYVFRAYLTDQVGRTFERSGNVVLLRKRL